MDLEDFMNDVLYDFRDELEELYDNQPRIEFKKQMPNPDDIAKIETKIYKAIVEWFANNNVSISIDKAKFIYQTAKNMERHEVWLDEIFLWLERYLEFSLELLK